ncbi:MAG: hypothetical protein JO306_16700 [Gemmatimonadetes bacterium]|nr:hypothetical protein [Gemmatimonadota bacterium]
MEKLKLPLDEVRVESFETGTSAGDRGTVEALAVSAGAACCTKRLSGCPDVTTIFTGQCGC